MNHTDSTITGNESTELQHNELSLCCEAQSHVKQSPLITLCYISMSATELLIEVKARNHKELDSCCVIVKE